MGDVEAVFERLERATTMQRTRRRSRPSTRRSTASMAAVGTCER